MPTVDAEESREAPDPKTVAVKDVTADTEEERRREAKKLIQKMRKEAKQLQTKINRLQRILDGTVDILYTLHDEDWFLNRGFKPSESVAGERFQ